MHGAAARPTRGERAAGLTEMREARAAFGDGTTGHRSWSPRWPSSSTGSPSSTGTWVRPSEVAAWLVDRAPDAGENLLLQAWTEVARGRFDAARTIVDARCSVRTGPALLPYTGAEAT